MPSTMRTWMWAFSSVFVTACGPTTQQKQGDPNDQQRDTTPTIVIMPNGGDKPVPKRPVEVAEDDPQLAIAANNQPAQMTDAELSALVRDPRRERRAPRHHQLLMTELQSLEALFAQVPKVSPDRPQLMRRLGYDYDELKFSARRDLQRLQPQSKQQKRDETARLEKLISAAGKMALKYYAMLVDQHPTFCQSSTMPPPTKSGQATPIMTGCIDDALYFMGLEQQELGSLEQTRKSFFTLIKLFPQSPWVSYAYLGFGEFFYSESKTDPSKRDFAAKSYEQVLKVPPSTNEVFGFANYRRAQVYREEQNEQMALVHFVKAIEFSNQYASLESSGPLGDAARNEMVPSYANVGAPRKAESFFQHLANDPPGSNERVAKMLDTLVAQYLRDNKRVEASDVCFSFSGGGNTLPACRSLPTFQASP